MSIFLWQKPMKILFLKKRTTSAPANNAASSLGTFFPSLPGYLFHIRQHNPHHIVHREWLGHGCIDILNEGRDLGQFIDSRHENNDVAVAQFWFGFEDSTYLFAVQHRHHHIEENQVAFLAAQYLHSFKTMTCCVYGISFKAENIHHHVANNRIVIYY